MFREVFNKLKISDLGKFAKPQKWGTLSIYKTKFELVLVLYRCVLDVAAVNPTLKIIG